MFANIFIAMTALLSLAAHVQGCTKLCCNEIIFDNTPNAPGIVGGLGIGSPIYPVGVGCFLNPDNVW